MDDHTLGRHLLAEGEKGRLSNLRDLYQLELSQLDSAQEEQELFYEMNRMDFIDFDATGI
jgi:hypothetical protein